MGVVEAFSASLILDEDVQTSEGWATRESETKRESGVCGVFVLRGAPISL